MKDVLIISTDVFNDLDGDNISNLLQEIFNRNMYIAITARFQQSLDECRKHIENTYDLSKYAKNIRFMDRDNVKLLVKNHEKESTRFVVVGNKDADLQLAAPLKLFYIVPLWCRKIQDLPDKYGFKAKSPKGLLKLLDILNNQQSWFFRLDIGESATVLALTNANDYGNHSKEEIEMIKGFKRYLKKGNKAYYNVLLAHFLASISNEADFKEIRDWGIIPSSGTNLNADMLELKEKARILMNGRKSMPIFIRHTATFKSHENNVPSIRLPCNRHFDTIIINPEYKNKLKGRVVCIFDDYLTNGTSFETARNLLLKEGVKKIYFVALGKFRKGGLNQYLIQNFKLNGELNKPGYKYKPINNEWANGVFDNSAIREIEELHNIIYEK